MCKDLLDCIKIDVEGGRCVIRLGLQLVKWVKRGVGRKREVCCPQQPGEGKLYSSNLKKRNN